MNIKIYIKGMMKKRLKMRRATRDVLRNIGYAVIIGIITALIFVYLNNRFGII